MTSGKSQDTSRQHRCNSKKRVNNQIHSHNTRTNNQMSILCMNRSKTKYCVLHNGKIIWNSLPDIFKHFQCSRARYKIFI